MNLECQDLDKNWGGSPWFPVAKLDAESGNVIYLDPQGVPIRSHVSQLRMRFPPTQPAGLPGPTLVVPISRRMTYMGSAALALCFYGGNSMADRVVLASGRMEYFSGSLIEERG